uniref:Uncharacterized protein n=2 Tax=Helianthus annuus TaxID=4232 RepID=A0A251VJN6_HELAN
MGLPGGIKKHCRSEFLATFKNGTNNILASIRRMKLRCIEIRKQARLGKITSPDMIGLLWYSCNRWMKTRWKLFWLARVLS